MITDYYALCRQIINHHFSSFDFSKHVILPGLVYINGERVILVRAVGFGCGSAALFYFRFSLDCRRLKARIFIIAVELSIVIARSGGRRKESR
jgi:hypothetical protein